MNKLKYPLVTSLKRLRLSSKVNSGTLAEAQYEDSLHNCIKKSTKIFHPALLLSIAMALLLWLGFTLLEAIPIALFLPLFFLFRRSLRFMVARDASVGGM